MNYDKILLNILIPNKRGIKHSIFSKITKEAYPNIFNYLLYRYSDSVSITESIKRLQLHIEIKPICANPNCNNPVTFIGKQSKMFTKYCSCTCRANMPENANRWIEKQKQYNIEHYGVDNNFKRKDVIEKRKQTLLNKYGTTNLYDVDWIREEIIESVTNKIEQIRTNHNNAIKEHYGCGFSDLMKLPEIQQKRNNTMKERGTFNSSKQEQIVYKLLQVNYPDTISQYRNNETYPFNCDFYVPSRDLYIECNFHWTHGGHPYNETLDVIKYNKWLELSETSKFYKNAINTWTKRDPLKRETAKRNNLNYIEFWNIKEVEEFVNCPND